MMIQQTSLYSFFMISEMELGKRQMQVYSIIKNNPLTNKKIAELLKLPINQVTPRTNELVKLGLIEKKGQVIQENRRQAILWGGR